MPSRRDGSPTRPSRRGRILRGCVKRCASTFKADIGFAQDPDADRLAIVDETGTYIGEEYTLCLATPSCAPKTAARSDRCEVRSTGPVVATNLSTSRMIDDIARETPVREGRSHTGGGSQRRRGHEAILPGAIIGGEGNGGVIWPKVIHVRDSLVGIALVLEMLAERGQPLSRIIQEVPATRS